MTSLPKRFVVYHTTNAILYAFCQCESWFYKRMSDTFKGSKIVTWLVRWDCCYIYSTPTGICPWTVSNPHSSCSFAGFRVSLRYLQYALLFTVDPLCRISVTMMVFMHSCPWSTFMHACTRVHTNTKTPWSLWLIVLPIWFQTGTSTSLVSCLSKHLTPCYIVQGLQMSETYVLHVSISEVPNTCILYCVSGS